MTKLAVNIDHVATLREARKTIEPDPIYAAVLVELAGADGIVIHLREDRRHINDRDLKLLREVVKTKLNLEMAATEEMISIARDIKPDMVTLVPEKRHELTTEGGLDVLRNREILQENIPRLQEKEIIVSVFIDPDFEQIETSKNIGADAIEIHTGSYAEARSEKESQLECKKIVESAKFAKELGLFVKAGHGITYDNVKRLASIDEIEEYSIGHSIVARAVFVGLSTAVREMMVLLNRY